MKTILTLLFCLAGFLAYAQTASTKPIVMTTTTVQESPKDGDMWMANGKTFKRINGVTVDLEKHKTDSIAALTIDYPLEPLTPAQEARLKEFDKMPTELQENYKKAIDELQKQKIAYIIGIIEAQKKAVDIGKVKDYEHKPNQLILKVAK